MTRRRLSETHAQSSFSRNVLDDAAIIQGSVPTKFSRLGCGFALATCGGFEVDNTEPRRHSHSACAVLRPNTALTRVSN